MHKNQIEILQQKTKNLNILYVEDDFDSRKQVTQIFELLFNTITLADNGQEGLELYEKGEFDLVITDINMPKMDGITMSGIIKHKNISQKIIIVSAHDHGEYLLSAIRTGVDGFILKPVEIEQLLDSINKVATTISNEKLQQYYQEELEVEVAKKTRRLLEQAYTDDLTGVSNRKKLMMDLADDMEYKVLILLNIDNFEHINATYGYKNGEYILQKISEFFESNLHPKSNFYRFGYDEFAFLFLNSNLDEAADYAKNIQELISKHPIVYENVSVKFTATIVLSDGKENLLRQAYIAFKETRQISKNRIGIYTPNSDLEIKHKKLQKYIHVVHDAIENKNIEPFFQPIINNSNKKIEKYECLARILNGDEILTPYQFIETAELTGMLPEITKIMIDKCFKYFQNRNEEFSINISEYDLSDNYLEGYLHDKVKEYSIEPHRVVLEVLEGISSAGAEKNYEQLVRLKEKGYQLAIDDFGAQNSNFERVHRLKVDYIKIDGSFVKNIDKDKNSYNVTRTIADFSKSVGAKVIAEYVHNEIISDKVLSLGIDYSQGYFFGKPTQHIVE